MIDDESNEEQKKTSTSSMKQRTKKINIRSSLMKNVTFVLNGFQNPLRSELRAKAISMGATYSDEWTKQCTHLM